MSPAPNSAKPPHAFALVLFAAAVLYVVGDIVIGYGFHSAMGQAVANAEGASRVAAMRRSEDFQLVRGAVQVGLEFIAAGVLIALLDSLRWLLTPEQDRPDLARKYVVSGLSRVLAGFRRKDGPE